MCQPPGEYRGIRNRGIAMALVKCPRCDLNYMNDTDEMCIVCRRELSGESERYDMLEMCSECGENPVVPGHELCASCLKELSRRPASEDDDVIHPETSSIEIDSVSDMDEIELDIGDDEPFDEDFTDDMSDENSDEDEEEE